MKDQAQGQKVKTNDQKSTSETPAARADRAYESIRQTQNLNNRLMEIGVVSNSFGLKRTGSPR